MAIYKDLNERFDLNWGASDYHWSMVNMLYLLDEVLSCEVSQLVSNLKPDMSREEKRKLYVAAAHNLSEKYEATLQSFLQSSTDAIISFESESTSLDSLSEDEISRLMIFHVLREAKGNIKDSADVQWLFEGKRHISNVGTFEDIKSYTAASRRLNTLLERYNSTEDDAEKKFLDKKIHLMIKAETLSAFNLIDGLSEKDLDRLNSTGYFISLSCDMLEEILSINSYPSPAPYEVSIDKSYLENQLKRKNVVILVVTDKFIFIESVTGTILDIRRIGPQCVVRLEGSFLPRESKKTIQLVVATDRVILDNVKVNRYLVITDKVKQVTFSGKTQIAPRNKLGKLSPSCIFVSSDVVFKSETEESATIELVGEKGGTIRVPEKYFRIHPRKSPLPMVQLKNVTVENITDKKPCSVEVKTL